MDRYKLVLKVIVPFILSLLLITIVTLGGTYYLQKRHIDHQSMAKFELVSNYLLDEIDENIELFKGLTQLLQKDEHISNLYRDRNRDWLFLYLYQTYLDFNDRYHITHLYIHDINKTNFLRLHSRDTHSDIIDRYTLDKAVETSAVSSGIEYSMNHNFTLRVVSPWFKNAELIGYIELGKEIDQLTTNFVDNLGMEIVFTIDKDILKKKDYSSWRDKISNNKKYMELDDFYIVDSTISSIRPEQTLIKILNTHENIKNSVVENNHHFYNISSKPFNDVTGKEVGKLYMLVDITDELNELDSMVMQVISLLVVIMLFIIYYYYKYMTSIEMKIKKYTKKIEFNYEFEQYLNNISNYILTESDINISIQKSLKELGRVLDVNRAYMFVFRDNYSKMDNTHEWSSEGIKPEIENLQNISTDDIQWWIKQCKESRAIVIERLDELPAEAENEKLTLQEQGIKSLLVYPVLIKGHLEGFIGVDMVEKYKKWSETHHSFLKLTAEKISTALDKKYYEAKIVNSHDDIALTLNAASNGILAVDDSNKITLYNDKLLQIWELDSIDEEHNTLEKLFEYLSSQFADCDKCRADLKYFNENREEEMKYLFYLKNGKIVEVVSSPRFEDNRFKGNSISFRDITKSVLAENELKLSSKVFENSLEGIIITDAQTNIIKLNSSFTKITGYSEDELIGKKPSILQSNWHDKSFYYDMWRTLKEESIWVGEVKDRRKNGELYISLSTLIVIKDCDGNITNYIGITRDVTDMKRAENHIKSLAYYDPLTDLPNRTLFNDRLEQNIIYCKRNEGKIALLFIDLDNFKSVNDIHGHHMGDMLLQKVAKIFTSSVRGSDTVSRLGGDEFTIILRKIHDRDDVIKVANIIIEKLMNPIVINDIPLEIGSSIGAAIFPDDTQDNETLMKMADIAMYEAKKRGKNRLKFFEEKLIK